MTRRSVSRRSKSASTPALCDDAVARGACSIRAMATALPDRPPFALRARVLTPLAAGGTRYEADGRIDIDDVGRIAAAGPWTGDAPGDRPAPAARAARHDRPPRPPAPAAERRRRGRARPADLAPDLHLPARAGVRRGGRRAPRAAC